MEASFNNRYKAAADGRIQKKGGSPRGVLALLVAAVMATGWTVQSQSVVFAAAKKVAPVKTVTGLGTGAIINPARPTTTAPWRGSYVYYGKYNGRKPTRYRVLDKVSGDFRVSGGSMLLDCDRTLYKSRFDCDGYPNPGAQRANAWACSDVKSGLNGDLFLMKPGNLTDTERNAIAPSFKTSAAPGDGGGWTSLAGTALFGEKIFLLDAKEATRASYGYSGTHNNATNRVKAGVKSDWKMDVKATRIKTSCASWWWLRSSYSYIDRYAGSVDSDGEVSGYNVDGYRGVSPAFNVGLPSVIFSSLIRSTESSPDAGKYGAEYKLTLKDSGLSVTTGMATRGVGDTIRIPYSITDVSGSAEPTRLSVAVMKGIWTANGWSGGAQLLQYTGLDTGPLSLSGAGTFALDGSRVLGTWGRDYHVYLLAEDVNGEKETDYASAPVEVAMAAE